MCCVVVKGIFGNSSFKGILGVTDALSRFNYSSFKLLLEPTYQIPTNERWLEAAEWKQSRAGRIQKLNYRILVNISSSYFTLKYFYF